MFYQYDKRLYKDIRSFGCFYLCLERIAEIETCYEGSVDIVNQTWTTAYKNGWIDESTNKIEAVDAILNEFIKIYNKIMQNTYNRKMYQVGIIKNDKLEYWQWAKRIGVKDYKYMIIKYITNTVFGTHFILADYNGNIIYDPFSEIGLQADKILKIEYKTLYNYN